MHHVSRKYAVMWSPCQVLSINLIRPQVGSYQNSQKKCSRYTLLLSFYIVLRWKVARTGALVRTGTFTLPVKALWPTLYLEWEQEKLLGIFLLTSRLNFREILQMLYRRNFGKIFREIIINISGKVRICKKSYSLPFIREGCERNAVPSIW